MPDELVCIATFDKVLEAQLCKSQLEAEGILAVLENEHTVNANWLWNNALGGIRLYVAPDDEDAAFAVLSRGRRIFHLDRQRRTDGEVAENAPPAVDDGLPAEVAADFEDDGPLESPREAIARRAIAAAVAGVMICPLQLYTIWLVWQVFTMPGPLRPLYRFYTAGAALVALPYVAVLLMVLAEVLLQY